MDESAGYGDYSWVWCVDIYQKINPDVLPLLRICSDGELMRKIWQRYDSQVSTGSKVYTSLVSALKRLATEKPALLGSSPQMMGVGVQSHSTDHVGGGATTGTSSYGFEVAGRVASVATATVSNVVGMIASGSGLSLVGSTMKIQWYVS